MNHHSETFVMTDCTVAGCVNNASHVLPEGEEKRARFMCSEHFQIYANDVGSFMGSKSTTPRGDSSHHISEHSFEEVPDVPVESYVEVPYTRAPVSPIKRENGEINYEIPYKRVKKKKPLLPPEAVNFLKKWLSNHLTYPYPTDEEKRYIAAQTNLALTQVTNWFINARRRILTPMLESALNETPSCSTPSDNEDVRASPHQINYPVRKRSKSNDVKKRTTQKTPSSTKKNLDKPARGYVDVTSGKSGANESYVLPDSTVTIGIGGEVINTPNGHLKNTNERPILCENSTPKTKRTPTKVVIPPRVISQVEPRTIPRKIICDSPQQSTNSTVDHDYIQSVKTNETDRLQPSLPPSRSPKVAKPSPSVFPKPSPTVKGRRTKAPPTRTTWVNPPGEDLLNSLYENLYLKSNQRVVVVKREPDTPRVGSEQNIPVLEETDNRNKSPASDNVRVKCEPTSSHSQASLQKKDRKTQTRSKVTHTTMLSHEMFQHKPTWVVYHTALTNYEQFKHVLNSLGPAAYGLTPSTGAKVLKTEDQLLMTLMKLRRAEPDLGLGIIFGVSKKTVKKIIVTWIQFMYRQWSASDIWPTEKITAREVFGPEGVIPDRPLLNGPLKAKGPPNTDPKDRVVKLYKILNKNLHAHYRAIADYILFVCCMLSDFRDSVITVRKF